MLAHCQHVDGEELQTCVATKKQTDALITNQKPQGLVKESVTGLVA